MRKKIVIIGGVAGGASTATRLRRLDEQAHIILFERGSYISYANCGLPYYIGGTIKERDSLFVTTTQKMTDNYNIDLRINQEIIEIDAQYKTVKVKKTETDEEYSESYDYLVIATGASPRCQTLKVLSRRAYLPFGTLRIPIK